MKKAKQPAKPKRGGARPGSGRKTMYVQRDICMTPAQWAWLALRGKESLGAALRAIVDELMGLDGLCHGYDAEECREEFIPEGVVVDDATLAAIMKAVQKEDGPEEHANEARYSTMERYFEEQLNKRGIAR